MNKEDFFKALEIISKNHTSEITINKPINGFVGDLGCKKFTIHISKCCHTVIKNLLDNGFTMHMGENGISVDKH